MNSPDTCPSEERHKRFTGYLVDALAVAFHLSPAICRLPRNWWQPARRAGRRSHTGGALGIAGPHADRQLFVLSGDGLLRPSREDHDRFQQLESGQL